MLQSYNLSDWWDVGTVKSRGEQLACRSGLSATAIASHRVSIAVDWRPLSLRPGLCEVVNVHDSPKSISHWVSATPIRTVTKTQKKKKLSNAQSASKGLVHSPRLNTVNSKHNHVKMVNNGHV